MINLYYVRGISLTDTPYFNSLQEQEEYFDNKLLSSIDAIYPPHYTNSIQFSNEDLDFNTQVNYLSLEFNGKTYYYFISDMRYIAEDLISVDITMDTFQTYMFDIYYHNARVERELIKRWNTDGTINRNYIRENFSSGLKENIDYYNITENREEDVFYYIVGYYVDNTNNYDTETYPRTGTDSVYNRYIPTTIRYNGGNISDGSQLIVIPIPYKKPSYITGSYNQVYMRFKTQAIGETGVFTNDVELSIYLDNINNNFKSNPSVYSAYITSYLPLNLNYNIYIENNKLIYEINSSVYNVGQTSLGLHKRGLSLLGTVNTDCKQYNYDFDFNKSPFGDRLGPFFDYHYIPQLLDENYYSFNFGERMGTTTFPLSKMTNTTLTLCRYIDLFTTNRYYWISDEDNVYNDKYLTMISNDSKEYTLLITDSWKNYLANNVGTIALGTALKFML